MTIRTMAAAATLAAAFSAAGTDAAVCKATSGPATAALVELYTSEGCNSCPPADKWLSAAIAPGGSGAGAIALAFHVDYWNRLGWPDRFAANAWTERQHAVAQANGASFVYTPQVTLQGRDFPGWRNKDAASAIAAAQTRPARATLALEARVDGGAVRFDATADVPAPADRRGAVLYVALTDSGHVSDVKAGENKGVRLMHDHVVRALSRTTTLAGDGSARQTSSLAWPKDAGRVPTLVAVMQNAATGDVLQALALPLEACR